MKDWLRIVLVGMLMGAAEVVPGVSGGTIAFVSGLYERLINGIQRLNPVQVLQLFRLGIRQWWLDHDINFLALLFTSMLVSVLILARGVSYLLEFHPVAIWSFFFGLVLASIVVVGRRLPLSGTVGFALGAGIAVAVLLTRLVPVEAEVTPLTLFVGGCIAVCAWILPGLSGSFILLMLGLYQAVIEAIKSLDVLTIGYVAVGCVVGLLSFSRVLNMLLTRFHDVTIAVLVGFMCGSLLKIWPWKHTTSYQLRPDGGQIPVVQDPVLPTSYQVLTGQDADILSALAAALVGVLLIVAMDRLALLAESGNREQTG